MALDGLDPTKAFDYVVPLTDMFELVRITLESENNAKADIDGFFTRAVLANGCLIQVLDINGNVIQRFGTDDHPIKDTAGWGILSGVDSVSDSTGGESRHNVRWTVANAGASMKIMPGNTFRVIVRDDLSGIGSMHMMLQGLMHKENH